MASARSVLGLCSFKDGDYFSEFAKTGETNLTDKSCQGEKDSTTALPFFVFIKVAEGQICTVEGSWPPLPTCKVVNRNRLSVTSNLLNSIDK